MPTRTLYFTANDVHVLDVDVGGLIRAILTLAENQRAFGPCEAVAVHARFTGGWYVFDFEDFCRKCAAFGELDAALHNEDSIKGIFDIHEYKKVPELAPGEPPGAEPPAKAVVLDNGKLAGVWASRYRPGAKPPTRGVVERGGDDDRRGGLEPLMDFGIESGPETVPPSTEPFRRTPHLDASVATCPAVGVEFDVVVFCDTGPARQGESSVEITIPAPATQEEFPVEVFLSPGTALRVVGPSTRLLVLRRSKAESEKVKFRVAVESAPATDGVALNAYFFHDGRPCGRVTRMLPVASGVAPVQPAGRIEVVDGASADLTVSVTRPDGSPACYRVKLTSPHLTAAELGEPALWDLGAPAQQYVTAIFANFIASRNDPANRLAALRGAGQNLFNAAPKNFKDAYERLAKAGTLKTILIVSDEPYIPWELMVPPTTREQRIQGIERDPIGVAHAVGRWVSDENIAPPARLRIARVLVVAPDYTNTDLKPLAQSEEEARYLKRRLRATVLSPNVYATITGSLKAQPPDLFHFIGHGNSSPDAPAQCLHLEDKDSLKPDVVFGEPAFQTAFAKQTPFVFLNACEVGQQTLALGGPAGFVPTFIGLFASSVIAPLWSVRDSLAHEVAQALYDAAIPDAGPPVPVAEVLRGIRARAYRGANAGEDSYAAYCFYGDPHFVIEATPVQSAPAVSRAGGT